MSKNTQAINKVDVPSFPIKTFILEARERESKAFYNYRALFIKRTAVTLDAILHNES